MATVTQVGSRRAPAGNSNAVERLGLAVWRTLTSVRFAVLQISLLAVAGVIGAVLRQVQSFALHDPAAYAQQMAEIHAAYDPLSIFGVRIGPAMVDVFERLGFFQVFSAPWFVFLLTLLTVSIVVCTIDRLPDLWRKERFVRVSQPAPFFDLRLDERARFEGVTDADAAAALRTTLRRGRFRVREERQGEVISVYGDRNQYFKLATLLTHLGLILFLAGAAVTTAFGFETVVFLGEGDTAPVQAVGTPDNLVVKNIHFEAPTREDGSIADFITDLAVFRNGQQIARKDIRVNDPLEVDGYVFHQNTFGPAVELTIHDAAGALVWDGPVILAGQLAGRPQGFMTIPGSELGLLVVLDRTPEGRSMLALSGITMPSGDEASQIAFFRGLAPATTSDPSTTGGYSVTWDSTGAYTGMVIKRDPGAGLIWIAFASLITGLVLTFYFPRRRVWARISEGRLELALLADRYVDAEREFEKLLERLADRFGNRPERGMKPSPEVRRA